MVLVLIDYLSSELMFMQQQSPSYPALSYLGAPIMPEQD